MDYDLEEIADIFDEYISLSAKIKGLSLKELQELPEDYRKFISLGHYLGELVLTGDEVIGVVERITDSYSKEHKSLEKELEEGKKETEMERARVMKLESEYEKLGAEYGRLSDFSKNLRDKNRELRKKAELLGANDSKIGKIEKIISGKKGAIIDEIKGILKANSEI